MSFVTIIAEHYFPWQKILHRPLPPIPAYVLGILAIALPYTVLMLIQRGMTTTTSTIAIWLLIGTAGFGTLVAHIIDAQLDAQEKAAETQQREEALRTELTR